MSSSAIDLDFDCVLRKEDSQTSFYNDIFHLSQITSKHKTCKNDNKRADILYKAETVLKMCSKVVFRLILKQCSINGNDTS